MTDSDDSNQIPESVRRALRRSGFPLQAAVAVRILSHRKFDLQHVEYPWQDENGGGHFIDLVALGGEGIYPIIECKKTQEEWIFLRPIGLGNPGETNTRFRCVHSEQVEDDTRRMEAYREDFYAEPDSIESQFCIVSTSPEGKTRLLERDASLLALGAVEFALDEQDQLPRAETRKHPRVHRAVYVPVIVTTASLYSARFDPSTVSLETGEFTSDPETIRPEKWVRFRKALTTGAFGLDEQSIFVVQAAHVEEFFTQLVTTEGPVSLERDRTHVPRRDKRRGILRMRRVHVVDDYLIGITAEPLHQVNRILTQGAARTEQLNPSLL